MKYEQITSAGQYPYPDHGIDPAKKGREFCMQYAKAAYYDFYYAYPKGIFFNNNGDYEKFRMYALGKQPNTPYKKHFGLVNDQGQAISDTTWLSVDWTIRPVVSQYRGRAIARILKSTFGVVATPVDELAKSEASQYLAQMKAKLAVQQLMRQQNPEMAQHPLISMNPGEPMDMEELNMRIEMGEQFSRSEDAEKAIDLGFYENDLEMCLWMWGEDFFDYGVAGFREWLGDDNHAKFRPVNCENIITNFCRYKDFRDLIHAAEVIDVSLIDLALVVDPATGKPMFTEDQLQEFAGTLAGRWGNPVGVGHGTGWFKPYDKFKCKVMDLEFFSYDDYNYKMVVDENGQLKDFRRADYGRGKVATDKYQRRKIKSVYKCKWIIGTDYCYDWGLAYDQKRSPNIKKKAETSLSFKFVAYNFYEMKAQGFMERLVPYLDDYQLTVLKIQNFKNRAVPSGWWIDLEALENAAMNKGGKNMTPQELLQMFFEMGILLGRSKDLAGNPMGPNWKPVIPIENTAMAELAGLYNDLINTLTQIERITGFNAITTGNANPKTLTPGYETADISTDDALYEISKAIKVLMQKLAADVLCRMAQGVRKGDIEGYMPYKSALNTNTLQFIKLSPDIAFREYGIMLEEASTDEEKAWLMQTVQQDIAAGLLDTSDAVLIINTHNVKSAQAILSYRVKKNKEAMAQQRQAEIQQANAGSQQAAMIAAQSAYQLKKLESDTEIAKKQIEMQMELGKEQLKQQTNLQIARETNLSKTQIGSIAADAKIQSSHIQNVPKLLESTKIE